MSKYETAVLCVVLTLATSWPSNVYAQKRNQIAGQVVDKGNHPIPGVAVKISRGAETLDKQRTDKNGQYVLKFLPGGPISTVLYECMDCYPCAIFNVSGSKDHNITKVIIKRGDTLTANEHSEIEATLTYLANNSEIPPLERERYANLSKTLPEPLNTPSFPPFPLVPVNADILLGVLQDTLTTKKTRKGDQFTLFVRESTKYYGAVIKGHVLRVRQGKEKAAIELRFDTITANDGNTHTFNGRIREVNEPEPGHVPEYLAGQSRSKSNVKVSTKRAVSGALIGSMIGSMAGDGKGAAVGAAIGAGIGTTTVIEQAAGELELLRGSGFIIERDMSFIREEPKGLASANNTADANAVLNKAHELYETGRDDEALAELRLLVSIEPNNAEGYFLLGSINQRRGDLESAVNFLKTAIFWNPMLIDAHLLLGRIFLERGDCQQAMSYARSAIRIDPNNQRAIALQRQITITAK
jgi:hypothetical protein